MNEMTSDTETSRSDQLIEEANKRAEEATRKRKAKTVSDKPKKTAAKKPAAKKAAKPKKTADRAPRLALSEKQLAEPRETIRILPAIKKMVEKYGKTKDLDVNEAAEKMLMTAVGRLGALARYNSAE